MIGVPSFAESMDALRPPSCPLGETSMLMRPLESFLACSAKNKAMVCDEWVGGLTWLNFSSTSAANPDPGARPIRIANNAALERQAICRPQRCVGP